MVASAEIVIVKPSKTLVSTDTTPRNGKANTPPVCPSNPPAPITARGKRFLCLPRWEAGLTDY